MNKFAQLALVTFGLFFFMQSFDKPISATEEIKFNQFIHLVEQDKVKEITFKNNGEILGEFKEAEGKYLKFSTVGDTSNPEVFKILMTHNVIPNYDYSTKNPIFGLLIGLLPMILFFGFMMYMLNKTSGQSGRLASFGGNKSKLVKFEGKVSFNDVAGSEDVKEDLKEIIDYLKDPTKYIKMGARVPKGVIMEGPPGTGKTLLAKATAGEAKVPFFSTSGSEFVEMFVGLGASRVRSMFEEARKASPCIVFIDEIDAIGKTRSGSTFGGGNDEREQTLNQILVEMDGFNNNSGVIIMAATNRFDVLDPALVRPGRFDRKVTLSNPDIKSREAILKVHSKNKPIDSSVDLNVVARGTPGFSGADLENLINEATLLAVRANNSTVSKLDFENARDKLLMGPERKTLVMSDDEKKNTAYHEAGHTLVGKLLKGLDPIHKVTIIPRGPALGLTQTLPTDDRVSISTDRANKIIAFLMGGRVAEELAFNEFTAGASNDISRATDIARKMVTEWGMSDMGPIEHKHTEQDPLSPQALNKINEAVTLIVKKGYNKAKDLLTDNIEILHRLSKELLDKETLNSNEIDVIINLGVLK
jgi:cell division protease FtsH